MIPYHERLERLRAKIQEKALPEQVSKVPKGAFDTLDTASGRHISQTERPTDQPKYPLFYTDAEREAARLDARRLGYPGRTLH